MFGAIVDIPPDVGYSVVFALIAIETMGIPVPGETALIGAGLLAHDGQLDIGVLIVVAAAAAIVGDNVGFAIGRKVGRSLFEMPGPFYTQRLAALAPASHSSRSTGRRRCSSGAGSPACGSPPRGWRG